MASISVVYSCGHSGVEDRTDIKSESIDNWIIWVKANKMCRPCFFAGIKAKLTREATEQARLLGLPSLHGSDKQISWALQVRLKILNGPPPIREGSKDYDPNVNITARDVLPMQEEVLTEIRNNSSSKWWIEQKDKTLEQLVLEKLKDVMAKMTENKRDFGGSVPPPDEGPAVEEQEPDEGGADGKSPF